MPEPHCEGGLWSRGPSWRQEEPVRYRRGIGSFLEDTEAMRPHAIRSRSAGKLTSEIGWGQVATTP